MLLSLINNIKEMFCSKEKYSENTSLSCSQKGFSELIAFIALICSLFVIIISKLKLKVTLYNRLIIQIIISEILDEMNILLSIWMDSYGFPTFENYQSRMLICFSQIYLGVFTCLWTLTASFFISLKLCDAIIFKKKIFKNQFFQNYTHIISIAIPGIISYIFWSIQVSIQSINLKDQTHFYIPRYSKERRKTQHFRQMYCFLDLTLIHFLCVIVALLIIGNSYLSFKGWKTVLNAKNAFRSQNDESRECIKQNLKKMNEIQNSLFLYPITADVLWILFFVLNYIFLSLRSGGIFVIASWIYIILACLRQLSYTLLYLFTNPKLKENVVSVLKCENCNKNRNKSFRVSRLNSRNNSTGPILSEGGDDEDRLN